MNIDIHPLAYLISFFIVPACVMARLVFLVSPIVRREIYLNTKHPCTQCGTPVLGKYRVNGHWCSHKCGTKWFEAETARMFDQLTPEEKQKRQEEEEREYRQYHQDLIDDYIESHPEVVGW